MSEFKLSNYPQQPLFYLCVRGGELESFNQEVWHVLTMVVQNLFAKLTDFHVFLGG